MMLEKIQRLRQQHLKATHSTDFYPYQEVISDAILKALIQNLRITAKATEEDIKNLKLEEICIEISRQAGKTTAVVDTVEFILTFLTKLFGRRINVGVFAPQREQAKTDFDRLKESLFRSQALNISSDKELRDYKEESNSNTLVLPNGGSCYIFPVTATSKPESKTLDLIIFEESQDLDDRIVKEQIWPMGASTNAPRVYIGTAGTRICHFYRLSQGKDAIKLYYDDIVAQRRVTFEKTGDARHLIYEQTVKQEIEKHGKDSDEIQRPYFGKWLIGTGQFVTQEDLDALVENRGLTYQYKKSMCFAGIDTAKHPDETWVTIIRYNPDTKKKDVLNWCVLSGENYQHQFDVICNFLSNYSIEAMAIDSTGQGDFMPDMFEAHTEWTDEKSGLYRVKFSAVSKDNIYKNLKVSIKELLTTLPNLDTKIGSKFRQQMLDLQQEYRGQLLNVKHPDDPNAHDDAPDSWALAEWAYAKYTEINDANIYVITDEKERKVKKDDNGNVQHFWPGDNDW